MTGWLHPGLGWGGVGGTGGWPLGSFGYIVVFMIHAAYAFVIYRTRRASICRVRSAIVAQLLPSVMTVSTTGPSGP